MTTIEKINAEYHARKIASESGKQENERDFVRFQIVSEYIRTIYALYPDISEQSANDLVLVMESRHFVQEQRFDSLVLRGLAEHHNPDYIDKSSGLEIYYRNRYQALGTL